MNTPPLSASSTPTNAASASNGGVPCLVFMRNAFGTKPAEQEDNAKLWCVQILGATQLLFTRIYIHAHFSSHEHMQRALTMSQAANKTSPITSPVTSPAISPSPLFTLPNPLPHFHPAGSPCLQKQCGTVKHSAEARVKQAGLDVSAVRRWILANKRVIVYDEVFRDLGKDGEKLAPNDSDIATSPAPLPPAVKQRIASTQKELGFADLPPSEHQFKSGQEGGDSNDETLSLELPNQNGSFPQPSAPTLSPQSAAQISAINSIPDISSASSTSLTQKTYPVLPPPLPSTVPPTISSLSTTVTAKSPPIPLTAPTSIKPLPSLKVYVKSRQGQSFDPNKVNQDRPLACVPLRGSPGVNVYGVMDGHGQHGHYVSEYVMHQIPAYLASERQTLRTNTPKSILTAMKNLTRDLKESHINLDYSGTTCVFAVHLDGYLHVANIGDSRCVIGRDTPRGPIAIPLTVDHKPDSPGEYQRIITAGGRVCPIPGMSVGPNRVWLAELDEPGLAMSRSIGDEVSARVGVIDIPEIMSHQLEPNDTMCLIASDGIWEFISNEEAIQFLFSHRDNPAAGVNQLVAKAVRRWQEDSETVIDDITVVLVVF